MPLKIHPVKLKETHYLLVPKNIAKMLDIKASSTFLLTIENGKNTVSLSYKRENVDGGDTIE